VGHRPGRSGADVRHRATSDSSSLRETAPRLGPTRWRNASTSSLRQTRPCPTVATGAGKPVRRDQSRTKLGVRTPSIRAASPAPTRSKVGVMDTMILSLSIH
jgi:hypothetical protein